MRGGANQRRGGRGTLARAAAAAGLAAALGLAAACAPSPSSGGAAAATSPPTRTPIKHLVVLFQENVSFDHYFGTYPRAANTDGTPFTATADAENVNGLSAALTQHNPNRYQPKRLGPAQAMTCDQDHSYGKEQKAFDAGAMDKFYEFTEKDTCSGQFHEPGLVMDYYDGNTVTALWNYAQRYAMSDNAYGTEFGPSTPGALNLISGQTHGARAVTAAGRTPVADPQAVVGADAHAVGTVIGDPDPAFDDCSNNNGKAKDNLVELTGRNIGDLLNERGVSWGWFQGGFRPTTTAAGRAVCGAAHQNVGGAQVPDYSPHHEPFQYYRSTANEHHVPPSSPAAIGQSDDAHHQYDLADFRTALDGGHLPAVSFLKAGEYQDGHAGYSDPLDEQRFLVDTVNRLQRSADWASTAVVIAYDDSDGWYDHVSAPAANGSADPANDALEHAGACHPGTAAAGGFQDRCGFGPRLPLLVISPYSRAGQVDHQVSDQTSVLRFIERNWSVGPVGGGSFDQVAADVGHSGALEGFFDWSQPKATPLLLDPNTGASASH